MRLKRGDYDATQSLMSDKMLLTYKEYSDLRRENERLRTALRKASVFLGCRLLDNDAAEQARIEVRDAVRSALSE